MKPPGPESRSGRPREAAARVATRGRRSPAALQGARGPIHGDRRRRLPSGGSIYQQLWSRRVGSDYRDYSCHFPYLSPSGGSRSPAAACAAWQTRAGRPDLRPRRSAPARPRAPARPPRPAPRPPRPRYTRLPRARCRAGSAPGGSPTAPLTCSLHVEGTTHAEEVSRWEEQHVRSRRQASYHVPGSGHLVY
nr:CLK4-associating serine/arginine rich protein-like [Manis javanica]